MRRFLLCLFFGGIHPSVPALRRTALPTRLPLWVSLIATLVFTCSMVAAQDGSSEIDEKHGNTAIGLRMKVRCTDDSLRLYPNATACADEREPESCRMVFTTTASSNPATRDPKCDNPLLKDLADQCRRTCAICCEDPSYACQNDESGIVNCNQNMEKCGMSEFSAMMIKFCPATCGLCLAKKCRDQIPDCEAMKSLCTNEIYLTFMDHQCAKTCGKCKSDEDDGGASTEDPDEIIVEPATASPRPRVKPKQEETCVDIMKNCHRNKKFCHHPSYKEMMKKNCAKTCGYCKPGQSGRGKTGSTRGGDTDGDTVVEVPTGRGTRECKDNHPYCKGWAANGYCESDEYTDEEKKEKCAKTCGYC